jgi:hypothetical protein
MPNGFGVSRDDQPNYECRIGDFANDAALHRRPMILATASFSLDTAICRRCFAVCQPKMRFYECTNRCSRTRSEWVVFYPGV